MHYVFLFLSLFFVAPSAQAFCSHWVCQNDRIVLQKKSNYPEFVDTGSIDTLDQALTNQIKAFDENQVPADFLRWNGRIVSAHLVLKSLQIFQEGLSKHRTAGAFHDFVKQNFAVFEVLPSSRPKIRFTGYYAPFFKARRTRSTEFSAPIHRMPPESLYAPQSKRRFFSRKQINKGALSGNRLEIAWLRRIDRFVLQLQGSGKLVFGDGQTLWANYAGNNGYPFTGIGTRMEKEGVVIQTTPWLKGFREYFRLHPEKMDHFFHQQKRYIFFKENNDGPYGMAGLIPGIRGYKLTAGRSMATHRGSFPIGALAFAQYTPKNKSESKVSRFLINQDTGGPLKQMKFVDLYTGSDKQAETLAGGLLEYGRLYLLLARSELSSSLKSP